MNKGKAALTGAASGAATGAVLGPWGAAAGGLIGGALGYFGADGDKPPPSYTPNHQNFQYGLGPSDSYASQEASRYAQQQQQLAALGADAYNRQAPAQAMPDAIQFQKSGGQGYLTGADTAGRQAQLQALGGIQQQTGALNQFANRAQGPSAAQAQLQAGTDMAARQQYGMARSQPGGGGAALRNAAFNAAGISGNAANAAATLRAQEEQSYRAQQLQALGAAQQGAGMSAGVAGQLRGADQGFAQAQAGQSNYDANSLNQFNQGQQQMQFNVGANNLGAAGQARSQNDAVTLATYGLSQGYDASRNAVAGSNTQQNNNYEAAKAQGAGLGIQSYNAQNQQNNAETGMALGALSSGLGAVGQMSGGNKPAVTSDVRAKTDIKPVSVLEALSGGKYSPAATRAMYEQQSAPDVRGAIEDAHAANARSAGPDTSLSEFGGLPSRVGLGAAGDARQARMRQLAALGAPDMRPAQGYDYAYRDPEADGAGRYVGPMAQDLEHLPGVVEQAPDGQKAINAPRLTLANTAAVSELQRKMDRVLQLQALGSGQAPGETTQLSPEEDHRFQQWVKKNGIRDLDHPDSHYDYRGFWKQYGDQPHQQGAHFTDEYKQHGHPSFSIESNYSKGIGDGGYWDYPNGKEQYNP
ncbi:MAG TPA: hypothetical protein VI653_13120, partial [Steroidobacteraceae bacterium]